MLEPGEYIVTVKDSAGCMLTDTVTVSTMVGLSTFSGDFSITISPNPGIDRFRVVAVFDVEDIFLPYTIHSAFGQAIAHGTIVRYDDKHEGEFSLKAFSAGTYYIIFHLSEAILVRRIVKVE
jgi:hypothetical protein